MPKVNLRKRSRVWYLDYRHGGRRFQESTRTENRQHAEILRNKRELDLFTEKVTGKKPKREEGVGKFFRRYLQYCETTKTPKTFRAEKMYINQWLDYFFLMGITKLNKITPDTIQRRQVDYLTNHSERSWNNALGYLKAALNYAVEWGETDANLIANVKPRKLPERFQRFSDDEIETLLENAKPDTKGVIFLGAFAGLRRDEMATLRWGDVDFKRQTITIRSDESFTPKTKKARTIPMCQKLSEGLRELKEKLPFPCVPNTAVTDSHYNRIGRNFRRLTKQLGIKGTIHGLRHTFASNLASKGVSLYIVGELLGQSDIKSTKIYSHLSPSATTEAVKVLD